jgi:hypothetical protein
MSLQFSCSTNHSVIRAQIECRPELSLREFISFGCVRSGKLLQHRNTYRELISGSLSFENFSVLQLINRF